MPFNAAQQFIKDNKISQFISFNDGQPHTVTLKDSSPSSIKDPRTKETLEGLSWKVTENGEDKSFFTRSTMLIQKLNSFNAGDTVTITMKKAPNENGELRTSFTVKLAGQQNVTANEESISEPPPEDDIDVSQIPF